MPPVLDYRYVLLYACGRRIANGTAFYGCVLGEADAEAFGLGGVSVAVGADEDV